jgi:hypothetical protein
MKSGRSLTELAAELQRQSETKRDFLAPQNKLTAVVIDNNDIAIDGINGEPFPLTNYAHGQVAEHWRFRKSITTGCAPKTRPCSRRT